MSVVYPEQKDLAITWPDMQENFPCERPLSMNPDCWYDTNCGGKNPAEWVLRRVGCCDQQPPVALWCTACKDTVLAYPRVVCQYCAAAFMPASTCYTSIEPLGLK